MALAGIDAQGRHHHRRAFADLPAADQDAVLRAVQSGQVAAGSFDGLSSPLVFGAILGAVVGVYYAHPAAWSEIGFGGPASPRGYVRIGLDERDPWEAQLSPRGRRP